MNFLISFSFSDRSFIAPFIAQLRERTVISKIEYNLNFEWSTVASTDDVLKSDFDELRIATDKYGTVGVQCLNNALPRIFGTEFTTNAASEFAEWMEHSFPDIIVYGRICEAV